MGMTKLIWIDGIDPATGSDNESFLASIAVNDWSNLTAGVSLL